MRSSILAAIAALAASAVATPVEAREVYAKWSATEVKTKVAHIPVGATFRLTAPAGYIANAPAFDVTCDISLISDPPTFPCTFNGPQAAGSKVEAAWNTNTDAQVTAWHTFGSTKASGSSGKLSYNTDFTIDVTNIGSA